MIAQIRKILSELKDFDQHQTGQRFLVFLDELFSSCPNCSHRKPPIVRRDGRCNGFKPQALANRPSQLTPETAEVKKAKAREYAKQYREKNLEKLRAYQRNRYYAGHAGRSKRDAGLGSEPGT
jgi:hypothetical protein